MNLAAIAIAALGATACSLTNAQVFRCPDPNGRTVLQQAPCMGGRELDVKPATGPDNAQNALAAKERTGRQGNAQDILIAISEGRPAIGMTEEQLRSALGNPSRINRANYQGRTSDQWVYHRNGEPLYVYVRNGAVNAFQSTEIATPGHARQCPTRMDIRNLETSASSVTISEERRATLRRQVAEAKACH